VNPPLQQSAILSESLTKKRNCGNGRLPALRAGSGRLPRGWKLGGGVGGEGDGALGADHPASGFYEGGWGAGIGGFGDDLRRGRLAGKGNLAQIEDRGAAGEGLAGAGGDAASAGDGEAAVAESGAAGVY
jgi:hypothetical protein